MLEFFFNISMSVLFKYTHVYYSNNTVVIVNSVMHMQQTIYSVIVTIDSLD